MRLDNIGQMEDRNKDIIRCLDVVRSSAALDCKSYVEVYSVLANNQSISWLYPCILL